MSPASSPRLGAASTRRVATVAVQDRSMSMLLGVDRGFRLAWRQGEMQRAGRVKCNEQADRDCRFVAYTNSIQDYWSGALPDYQCDTFAAAAL